MSETAATQLNRIVQMIAELSRREREGLPSLRLAEVAERMGVSEKQIEKDIRTLTAVGEDADHEWVGSLSVLQEGDQIALSSRGTFQRPVRLTPDELLAIQIGLAGEDGTQPLSRELAHLVEAARQPVAAQVSAAQHAGADESRVVDLARAAAAQRRCLEIVYAGAKGEPGRRIIEVHGITGYQGRYYLRSWCRAADGERIFRADRVLDARLLPDTFDGRPLPDHDGVFAAPPESREAVRVRFHPAIARWVAEEHPHAEHERDGAVVVTYEVTEPAWLARTVLGYGEHAEVIDPPAYRRLMRLLTGGEA